MNDLCCSDTLAPVWIICFVLVALYQCDCFIVYLCFEYSGCTVNAGPGEKQLMQSRAFSSPEHLYYLFTMFDFAKTC